MESFCNGTTFWDVNRTWYAEWPYFGECFQNTVLIWIASGWLWTTAPFYLRYLCTLKHIEGSWSWITYSKVIITAVLLIIVLIEVVTGIKDLSKDGHYWKAYLVGPSIEGLTLMLLLVYIPLERYKGLITSGVLHIYWTLANITYIIPFYTKIITKEYNSLPLHFVVFNLYYGLSLVQWILYCIPEKVTQDVCPEQKSSFISRITFSWMTSLMLHGYRKPLTGSDVFYLNRRDKCNPAFLRFSRTRDKQENYRTSKKRSHDMYQQIQDKMSESTPLIQPITKIRYKQPNPLSLLNILVRTFGIELLHAHIWKVFYDVTIFISPFLLRLLIQYTEALTPGEENSEFIQDWKGYVLALGFFVTILFQSVMFHQQSYWTMTLGLRVRAALISAVYRKALRLTNTARKESASGEIVNLMAIDTVHIQSMINFLWAAWSTPLQIGFSLYFLYDTVGPSVFAGFSVLVLLFLLNGLIMTQVHKLQGLQMKQKDCRIKLLTEILNGIKVLKLYAWELLFKEKILSIRETELKILWKASIIGIGFTFSWTVAPYIVSLATFTTYIFTSATHYLDAQTAFVAISFFNILRFAINFAPMAISEAIKASVSLKRLNKFLRHEELDPDNVMNDNLQEEAITVEDGKFLWDIEAGTSLKNIHLSIPEKSLVAIVGPVGCGKSSLISALLGDMIKVKGSVNVKGTKAYVPQQPWIQNGTLQDNILFGRDIDHECYNRVIDACALRPDIDILNNGDQTFIGEKGINLSGGQKQRVSLARAVYHNTDIYLLDDPLSAVDSHVGKHIFEHVIGKNGVLKDKSYHGENKVLVHEIIFNFMILVEKVEEEMTRVLVTHGLRWLPYVDNIIVMVNGTVIETGTYDDLLSSNGTFSNVLKIHMTEMEIKDDQESSNKIWKKVKFDLYDVENEKNLEQKRLLQTNLENIPTMQMAEISVHKGHLHRIKSKYQLMLMHEKPSVQDIKSITEEKIEEGNVRIQVFITYARALGVSYTMIIMFFYACYQTSSVFSSLWLSQWTSDALLTNRTLGSPDSSIYRQRNDYYLGIYGGAGIAQAIFVLSYVGLFVSRSISASHLLHQKMVHSIVRSPMSFFDLTPIGRIINRFSADIDTVDNVLPLTVEMWLDCVFAVIATLIVICYSTPIFLVTILPLAVVYFFVQRFYVSTSRQLRRLEAQSRSPLYNHFGETISGASVIRAFDAEDRFIKISDDRVDLNQKFSFARIGANRWLGIRLEFLGNIVIFAAAMFAVLARGHIDGAMVGLSVTYALQITGTLNWLVRMTSDLETNIVAVERIQEYTELKHEADLIGDYRPSVKWPQKGCVNFKNYSTKYRDDLDLVLKDITTTIHGGEKVGIVGRTGAGKSSLTLAMFRLVEPVSGSIMIDGEDLSRMGLHDCRSKLTILPQDPVLFSGSLKMNLDPQDQHSDEDIWQALEHAHLKDFLLDSSQNLEFDCGEGGQNLSIGQRQLVCLARSLLKKTKLLILDEATAAIDLETDDLIQHTIHKTFRDCTVITIAHRLHTVINYDRIMVLDEGEIREFDTPDRLLQNTEGLFYQLAQDAGII